MPRIIRILTIPMALLFLLAVVVQYNDPDPLRWMLIYAAATIACGLALRDAMPPWLPIVTGVVAAAWAAMLLPRVLGQVAPGELFRETGMATLAIEEAREMLGLALVAGWMLVLIVGTRRR